MSCHLKLYGLLLCARLQVLRYQPDVAKYVAKWHSKERHQVHPFGTNGHNSRFISFGILSCSCDPFRNLPDMPRHPCLKSCYLSHVRGRESFSCAMPSRALLFGKTMNRFMDKGGHTAFQLASSTHTEALPTRPFGLPQQ